MSRTHFSSRFSNTALHIAPPPRKQHPVSLRRFCVTLFLSLLLLSEVSGAGVLATPAFAASRLNVTSTPGSLTFQQFVKLGRHDRFYHGPYVSPRTVSRAPLAHASSMSTLPPGAEPVKMKPISQSLDAAFLAGGPGVKPLDLVGSDGRVEVQLQPGSLDLSHASSVGGAIPGGTLTLQISELSGHYAGSTNVLGTYQLRVMDSAKHVVSGIRLRTPVSLIYHYQPWEMEALNIDPGHVLLTWSALVASAQQAKQPLTGLILNTRLDASAHTLTALSGVLGPGPFSFNSDPLNQAPPIPHLASVQGNAGQLSYGYPLQVPPGVAGFAPQLSLDYSSSGPNGRNVATSPANDTGDGWSLSLGSISADTYPTGSASAKTWYFISGVGNVSDRLVQDTSLPNQFHTTGTFFDTEHLSYLLVQEVFSQGQQPCFNVWDRLGTFYEFGCTADSLQYSTDSSGTRTNYRWDVDKIVAPNEGPGSSNSYKIIQIIYQQDKVTTNGNTTIRDAAIQQVIYGDVQGAPNPPITHIVGTVDFTYLAPNYSQNYNCTIPPPVATTLRCDDPLNYSGGSYTSYAPTVMSTLSLQKITSYVGADSANKPAYGYSFSYTDTPFVTCVDPNSNHTRYCAGEHLLKTITPIVYQQGTPHNLPQVQFNYTLAQDTFYDPANYPYGNPTGITSTSWQYLTSYLDNKTGIGATVSYGTAYNNTHGTPYRTDSNGNITDDRHDPLYCFLYAADCANSYAHPDDKAWASQVVTQLQATGKDSANSQLPLATTTYHYQLAVTGQYTGGTDCYPYPSPSSYPPGQGDCTGDNWIPKLGSGLDADWADFFHSEYRGFALVSITGTNGDLTVDQYASTEGWGTPDTDFANYGAGHLMNEKIYQGSSAVSSALLRETTNAYAGGPMLKNPQANSATACVSAANTDSVYTPCEIMVTATQTLDFEAATGTIPSVESDFTYDDYATGLISGKYHQLQTEVITSSNAPTLTKQWTYYTNVQVGGSWTYYNVDFVKHSEIDDSTGHIWQCQYITYDENSGVTTPAAGWPTTQQTYSNGNCANLTNPITTSYTGYDTFGNPVASVDGVAQANSSVYQTPGGSGCTLSASPAIMSTAWLGSHNYTTCTTYDSYHAQPITVTAPLAPLSASNLSTSVNYDDTQGSLPTSSMDMNGQVTTTTYSYDGSGNRTIQVKLPGEANSYTAKSSTRSSCVTSSVLPCFEVDSVSSQYSNAVSSTFYDALGRIVETSTPGPAPANPATNTNYYTIVLTEYKDDITHSVWKSNPFVIGVSSSQTGSGYVDPNNAKDYNNGPVYGAVTYFDALGRPIAALDPIFNAGGSSGISCPPLGANATACTIYGLGQASGSDTNIYSVVTNIDPNNHVTKTYLDVLGRAIYVQRYSGAYGSISLMQQQAIQYNVLNEPTSVKVIDEVATGNPFVTTTASYNDLGRLVTLNDPDRGTHQYTYDADGRVVADVSGSRTIGYSYDLMGRLGCVQDQAPPASGLISPTGGCSTGANPFAQYTYDVIAPGAPWSTDYPKGRLTQTRATNYFPSPDNTQGYVTEQAQYDVQGRVITQTLGISASGGNLTFPTFPTYQLALQYNSANQVTQAQTSSSSGGLGDTVKPVYDSTTGVQTGVDGGISSTPLLGSLTYNPQGLLNSMSFLASDGSTLATEQLQYDGDLRPGVAAACWQGSSCTITTTCPTAAFFCQNPNYDAASNIINLTTMLPTVPGTTNSGGSETQVFCYDEQNRMVWAGNKGTPSCTGNGTPGNTLNSAGYQTPYVYTNLGQLSQGPLKGTGTSSYQYLYCDSTHPHELMGLYASGSTCANKTGSVYTSSYDAWGNVTTRFVNGGTTANMSYDGLDHLVRWNDVVTTTNEEWYLYDASGNRVMRRSATASSTTYTIYAFGREEHIYNGSGTIQSSNYYYTLAGRELGKSTGSSALTFYLSDALGSILTSFSGASGTTSVSGTQTYGPYGSQQFIKGQIGTNKGFAGQYNDSLSGLDYFGARYYDAAVGVFLSADTVMGNLAGANPYAYVGGNPETFSDPSGHMYIPVSGEGGSAPTGPLSGGTSWTVPGKPFNFNNVVVNSSKMDTSGMNTGAACVQVGCRSNIQLDTGSSWHAGSPGLTCLGGVGLALCILVPTFYRLNTPPITIHYCPTGCQDGEGGEGDQSKAAEDLGGGFASSDTIEPAGAGGDPAKPGATDGGASLGEKAAIEPGTGSNPGRGPIFSHFTNVEGVSGITGVDAASLAVDQTVIVNELKFGQGANLFMANEPGDIFVTELGPDATSRQLAQIGVFGDKQSFAIQFSLEAAVVNDVIPTATDAVRSIFTIPGDSVLTGFDFFVTRLR